MGSIISSKCCLYTYINTYTSRHIPCRVGRDNRAPIDNQLSYLYTIWRNRSEFVHYLKFLLKPVSTTKVISNFCSSVKYGHCANPFLLYFNEKECFQFGTPTKYCCRNNGYKSSFRQSKFVEGKSLGSGEPSKEQPLFLPK